MEKKKKVYIVLSDTGTWFTRLIRLYTKAQLNHASIAFDIDLNEVYSFGRKRPNNPFFGGFVKEDVRGELFKGAMLSVYDLEVSDDEYRAIRAVIEMFDNEPDRYSYNLIGLIGVMINVPVKRKDAFFCSQFVAHVLEQAGASIVPKCAELTTPADFGQAEKLTMVYQGNLGWHEALEMAVG
jgi:hypothetical protein